MKCPKCQTENPDERKFCHECGAKLILVCSKCGAENLPSDKFCGECGYNLTLPSEPSPKDLSFDEKLDKIQRYLPKGLTEKILSQRDKIEGERKQVTVMFCDMEGFTTLVEKTGPEEAYSIMDQVYEILIHRVHDYEGTVNEMTGDGIMALFGAPIALEDAPQRAIRSALSIHREMAKFADGIKQEKETIPPLRMRIGINTGTVVVGPLGNDLRVEFKAVGDTVNLASRMEGLAEPGTTYVTEETFRLTEGFFRFEALGERIIKGKEASIKLYRVLAPSTRRTRFDVSAERGLTPFVGRERELELLLDGFERSKEGRGQAFSIVSEAGVGKSRLLYEFRKAVAHENATFLEGKCLSYSRGVAYHPVIDILKANFNIQEGDGDLAIREKVKEGLKILGVDEPSTLPYLLELLSVKDSGIDKIPMSPEERKVRITGALNRIVLKGSELRPLIMAYEDLHWSDKSSEESLRDLLDSIAGARVFLIFTYRPEFVHTWGARSYHSQVNLNRLSNPESLSIVTHLLGTENIDRDLEELVLEKTEGVPFFIEEFIRSLRDLNIIERKNNRYHLVKDIQKVTIPSTIQDVIMARVDSLPEAAKEVLQLGSVIEREFNYELIKHVTGLREQELLSHLSVLKDSELLYERGVYPESVYVFKHALTRDVVYESMITKRRKKLHGKIANAIEYLYRENIDTQYGLLANHYIESERFEKGAEYARLAGKKAQKKSAFIDAISYINKCIFCLERLPNTEAIQKKIIDIRTTLAGYHLSLGGYLEAKEAVYPILDLAIKIDYKKRLPAIFSAIGHYNMWTEEDHEKGMQQLIEAIEASEKISDFVTMWLSSFHLIWTLSYHCEFERAYKYYKKCQDLSKLANNLLGLSTSAGAICIASYTYQGKLNLAYETSRHALEIAEKIDDIFAIGLAHVAYGNSLYYKGLMVEAEDHLLTGSNICENINQTAWGSWAYTVLGLLYYDIGKPGNARKYHAKAISLAESNEFAPSFTNFNKICLIRADICNSVKVLNMGDVLRYYNGIVYKSIKSWMAQMIGEIFLIIPEKSLSDSENWIKKAIEGNKVNGTKWLLAHDYLLYAELLKQKGDQLKARESLGKAIGTFKECGADGWLGKAEKKLAAIS